MYKRNVSKEVKGVNPYFVPFDFLSVSRPPPPHTHKYLWLNPQIWTLHWTSSGGRAGSETWNTASLMIHRCVPDPPLWHGKTWIRNIFTSTEKSFDCSCIYILDMFIYIWIKGVLQLFTDSWRITWHQSAKLCFADSSGSKSVGRGQKCQLETKPSNYSALQKYSPPFVFCCLTTWN